MDHLLNLTAFVRVVENGGFTAAARPLNLSTTMVSNHVQELEDQLGARLLNRTTRKVSLTEIGRQYYERSLHILAELDEADRAAGALNATPRGRLRVHCQPYLAADERAVTLSQRFLLVSSARKVIRQALAGRDWLDPEGASSRCRAKRASRP
jgi:DNA-binding transcriptional LysR family regulator